MINKEVVKIYQSKINKLTKEFYDTIINNMNDNDSVGDKQETLRLLDEILPDIQIKNEICSDFISDNQGIIGSNVISNWFRFDNLVDFLSYELTNKSLLDKLIERIINEY